MKTFKQHIKEYKGYAGDAKGVGTDGYQDSIEDGSVHSIHECCIAKEGGWTIMKRILKT